MEDNSKGKGGVIRRSRYLIRSILPILALLLLLFLIARGRLVVSTVEFFYQMEKLPPWPGKVSENTREAYPFDQMRQIAHRLLEQPEQDRRQVIAAYHTYIKLCDYESSPAAARPASKLYVLLRLLFDVSEDYPRDQAKFFGAWTILRMEDNSQIMLPPTSEDERTINLLWPLGYENGRLVLKGAVVSNRGFTYDGLGEYDYFVARFPFRAMEDLK